MDMKESLGMRTVIDRIVGVSYYAFFFFWIGSTIVFAVAYTVLSAVAGHGPTPIEGTLFERFWQALYFSVITATSTGFGDIAPHGISRFLAALQSATSIFALAVFVAKVTARRQDEIMRHVHTLSFGVAFNDIRQGLFIARKDMDALLKKVRAGEHPTSKDWLNLYIALREVQIFVRSIPNFYNARTHTQLILDGQEALLFDAVERTLGRVEEIIRVFENAHHPIIGHNDDCTRELYNIVKLIDAVFPSNGEYVIDPANAAYLKELVHRNAAITAQLARHEKHG